VGFKSESDAAAALKYFNRSFMGAVRLEVEYAFQYGAIGAPRAWSRHTSGTSANRAVVAPTGANNAPLGEPKMTAREAKKAGKKARQLGPEQGGRDTIGLCFLSPVSATCRAKT
jgi:multiple RNA-binding domain-containing protein 1